MAMNKKMLAIDLIIVLGSLIIVALYVGYSSPLVIAPIDDLNTTSSSVLFEFEKADKIMIDENPEFTSPREINVKDNLVVTLKPGTYYWKVSGITDSAIRKLTIISEINLKMKDKGEKVELVNSGNVDLNVDVYDENILVDSIELRRDENAEVSGNLIVGGENE